MRKRSNTLYADSFEEYFYVAQYGYPVELPSTSKPQNCKHTLNHKCFIEDQAKRSKSVAQRETRIKVKKVEKWDDFDFTREEKSTQEDIFAVRNSSNTLSKGSIDTIESDYVEDTQGVIEPVEVKFGGRKRIMVIGRDSTGKRSLINSVFQCEESQGESESRVMDLLMKKENEEGWEVRYEFWMKNIGTKGKEYEEIFKVYYKRAKVFMFVYSINDKGSFEILEKEIEKVMKEVVNERFVGVLVGSKSDLEIERQVSLFEGIALQEKYKLTFFIETNWMDLCLKERLRQLVKDGYEGSQRNSENHCSILSLE